jgi:membrane-associated phospholipid phosphatase
MINVACGEFSRFLSVKLHELREKKASNKTRSFSFSQCGDQLKTFFYFLLAYFSFLLTYGPTSYLSTIRSDNLEMFISSELEIPLLEWTIFLYCSLYLVGIIPLLRLSFKEKKYSALSVVIGNLVCGVVFFFFPTVLGHERNLDLISENYKFIFDLVWSIDPPHNAMPSLHVVFAFFFLIPCLNKKNSNLLNLFFLVFFSAISFSILTVHQHHVIDLITGFILSLSIYYLFYLPKTKSRN